MMASKREVPCGSMPTGDEERYYAFIKKSVMFHWMCELNIRYIPITSVK